MAYIWRLSAIWLWKETTSWTAVPAQVWIPKESGTLNPSFEEARDSSWYWVIDEIYESYTTKNFSNITLWGIARDDFIGYLLLWALGKYTKVKCFKASNISWWTPTRWDTVPGWTLKKILKIWDTNYYFFDWTISTWSVSNWTRTMTITEVSWVKGHFFERLNSNQHPSFTIYDDDPIAWSYAPYCMINTFELSCEAADYVKFNVEFQGKQMQSASDQNPVYSDEAPFLASMAGVRFANNESWLNTASEQCMQNFRVSINKNLTDIQCFWSTDIDSIYNQQFWVEGDFEALYESTTLRDYVVNSQKKALRFYAENKNTTQLATWIYPSIYVDLMKVGLNERTKTDTTNEIIKQTMWFTGQYSNNDSASIEVLLLNSNWEWY